MEQEMFVKLRNQLGINKFFVSDASYLDSVVI